MASTTCISDSLKFLFLQAAVARPECRLQAREGGDGRNQEVVIGGICETRSDLGIQIQSCGIRDDDRGTATGTGIIDYRLILMID